jgi:hypothetical protein
MSALFQIIFEQQNIVYILTYLSGIGSACCNPSVWGDGIRGWLEDGSPPKEVARSLWCPHWPYGHVKPSLETRGAVA